MGNRTTHSGKIRSHGGRAKGLSTPAVVVQSIRCVFATNAAQQPVRVGISPTVGEPVKLPKGALIISWTSLNVVQGVTPVVHIGTAADPDGIFPSIDADAAIGTISPANGLISAVDNVSATGLSADTTLLGINAAGTPTGNVFGLLSYVMSDDGEDQHVDGEVEH